MMFSQSSQYTHLILNWGTLAKVYLSHRCFFLLVHRDGLIDRQTDKQTQSPQPPFLCVYALCSLKTVCVCWCVNGCIRHLPTIIAAMLNENDETYWVGDQRTTIYNHSQPADLTTHNKHTILYREPLPSCFYCPSLQLLDRGDGKAFSWLRYRPCWTACMGNAIRKLNDWER